MRAQVNTVTLEFAGSEMDMLRQAYEVTTEDTPFDRLPEKLTPRQVRQLRRVVGNALSEGEWDTGERVTLLRIRKQLGQVSEECKKVRRASE